MTEELTPYGSIPPTRSDTQMDAVDSTIEFLSAEEHIDRKLIAEFFTTFARTEYALKTARFINMVGDQSRGAFAIDWDRFADEIEAAVNQNDFRSDPYIRYLMRHPPKKEVLTQHGLEWKPRSRRGQSAVRFLVRSVTTVRNNLFHGGKSLGSPLLERDRQLMEGALRALKRFVTLHDVVLAAFRELPIRRRVA